MPLPAKNINFAETVEESVALVGVISRLYTFLDRLGAGGNFRSGERAALRHVDLMTQWQDQATARRNPDGIYALFRACREIINPVQSNLQNLVRAGTWPPSGWPPGDIVSPDQLLRAIIRAKEEWAYIDAHPQVIIRRG